MCQSADLDIQTANLPVPILFYPSHNTFNLKTKYIEQNKRHISLCIKEYTLKACNSF